MIVQKAYEDLYTKLKSYYIKEQSNEDLEYQTLLAAFSCKKYQECLFLAQDLLVSRPKREVFIVILNLCINHLNLGEMALHYSSLALETLPQDDIILCARGVCCLYNANLSLYQQTKTKLLEEAKEHFDNTGSTGQNVLFFKAITYVQLGKINEAMNFVMEGLRITINYKYTALGALILAGQEDFTGALSLIKRGLQACPCNILLYTVKVYCKFLMYEYTHDKIKVKKSIKRLIKMYKDNTEDSGSSRTGVIKEEGSNVDSEYFDDVFKDFEVKDSESLQQVLKFTFKIAVEIEDLVLAEKIYLRIKENRIENAILMYFRNQKSEELENFVEDLWVCEVLGQAKYDMGDKNTAISICKQAIRLNENSKKAWMLLGKIYKEQNLLEDSMEAYLKALKALPINFAIVPIILQDF
ncbi:hypothetical protein SteCoe_12133 [Stentor coeruleus]|uniref:Uncharacterized protein n=1 Tax=Stentor coeruleus TaxID=5963 RepID=A0A1R2CBH3_9CILI|nr:hypothetical protein SteCoe_12133 [Stentor coeruleus]